MEANVQREDWKERYRLAPGYLTQRDNQDGVKWDGAFIVEREEPGPDGTKVRRIIMTTSHFDRANDAIAARGIQFNHYKNNPVILWSHMHGEPAIGTSSAQEIVTLPDGVDGVRFVFSLHRATALSKDIDTLLDLKVIRTGSISVIPLTWEDLLISEEEFASGAVYPSWSDRRRIYTSSECIEGTLCNVPMNPVSLVENSYDKEFVKRVQEAVVAGDISSDSPALAGLDKAAIVIPSSKTDRSPASATNKGRTANDAPQPAAVQREGRRHSEETRAQIREIFEPLYSAAALAKKFDKAMEDGKLSDDEVEDLTGQNDSEGEKAIAEELRELQAKYAALEERVQALTTPPRVEIARAEVDKRIQQLLTTNNP